MYRASSLDGYVIVAYFAKVFCQLSAGHALAKEDCGQDQARSRGCSKASFHGCVLLCCSISVYLYFRSSIYEETLQKATFAQDGKQKQEKVIAEFWEGEVTQAEKRIFCRFGSLGKLCSYGSPNG
jgi:hypothetical protein